MIKHIEIFNVQEHFKKYEKYNQKNIQQYFHLNQYPDKYIYLFIPGYWRHKGIGLLPSTHFSPNEIPFGKGVITQLENKKIYRVYLEDTCLNISSKKLSNYCRNNGINTTNSLSKFQNAFNVYSDINEYLLNRYEKEIDNILMIFS